MRSATVLIVEDDDDIREAIRALLEDEAYAVFEADDGQAGLAALRISQGTMVVLLDYMMPRMNGFALLRTVAQDAHLLARFRFILLTANEDRLPDEFARLIAALHVPIVGKPFDLRELLNAVAAAHRALPEEDAHAASRDVFD